MLLNEVDKLKLQPDMKGQVSRGNANDCLEYEEWAN